MKILSLDISTKTGWALVTSSGLLLEFGTVNVSKPRGYERWMQFRTKIKDLIANTNPHVVVIEGYSFSSPGSLSGQVELGTIARLEILDCLNQIPIMEVAPNSLKKFVIGKGAGKKEVMMLEVYKRWKFEGTNDECDAYGLAMFVVALLNGIQMPKINMEATEKWVKEHPEDHQKIIAINCKNTLTN